MTGFDSYKKQPGADLKHFSQSYEALLKIQLEFWQQQIGGDPEGSWPPEHGFHLILREQQLHCWPVQPRNDADFPNDHSSSFSFSLWSFSYDSFGSATPALEPGRSGQSCGRKLAT